MGTSVPGRKGMGGRRLRLRDHRRDFSRRSVLQRLQENKSPKAQLQQVKCRRSKAGCQWHLVGPAGLSVLPISVHGSRRQRRHLLCPSLLLSQQVDKEAVTESLPAAWCRLQ